MGQLSEFADCFLANADGLAAPGGGTLTRFVYDSDDGRLYFDPDGTGAAVGRLVAALKDAPLIKSSDSQII